MITSIIIFAYIFIFLPILKLAAFYHAVRYTLDDYYSDLCVLNELGKYPSNRKSDKIYQILRKYWERYKLRHKSKLRVIEIKEVEKMLNCKDRFFLFKCAVCEAVKILYSSCNSRVCTCCGKKHVDRWSKQLCKTLYKKVHRHIVLTMPDVLWPYFKKDFKLLKKLMDCSKETFDYVLKETKHKDVNPAFLVVLHTYSRSMDYNQHLHLVFAEGSFSVKNKWIDVNYFEYGLVRKAWQRSVLEMLKREIGSPEIYSLAKQCYDKHPKGFYIYAKDRIEKRFITVKYIGRYIRHPAIASSRIISFDDKEVTFYYLDHETNEKIYRSMTVDDFITALIGHIPDEQFKMIRYYGAYSRRSSKLFGKIMGIAESIKQKTLKSFGIAPEKYRLKCDRCKTKMVCVWYSGKRKPPDSAYGGRISDWIEALGSFN